MIDIEQKYGIIGKSDAIKEVISSIEQVAPTNISILIVGESGTGKELVARAIHLLSNRKNKAYIVVNCGAIPSGTIESELFGHKKGSFTGAVEDRKGFFEAADGGTIFLDEIGELPLETQVKLLRVLESGEIIRVGESIPRHVDVRLLAATNRDLKEQVLKGEFRKDLYYRIKTITIHIPPLRERREDIPMLAEYFMIEYADRNNLPYKPISPAAMKILESLNWQGNIRELRNFIQSVFILEKSKIIQPETVREYLQKNVGYLDSDHFDTRFPVRMDKDIDKMERELILQQLLLLRQDMEEIKTMLKQNYYMLEKGQLSLTEIPQRANDIENSAIFSKEILPVEDKSISEMEKELIEKTLEKYQGSKRKTAQALKISERTLYRKLKEYGIQR
ncbi:MAG: sigma-54 dependent transcriptional regulator [Candidatus Marinimicrobia bacterium]|nr:sigma-54 dependent transcriptional regulator [Candidatus Neomarinimicrobiota bacterium]MDD5582569.1 sigma-54 dependent transcriptional regulator [Candidatus Neomarinimicrobiota bacterium]